MGRRQEEQRRQRGPTWGSPGRRNSWPAALLAAAVLSPCVLLAQAQEIPISVTVEPSQLLEGQDVTLTPGGNPTFIICDWFRGGDAEANRIFTYIPSLPPPGQQNGPGFTGRETGGPGCSLHIRSLMLNYTGDYVVSKSMIKNHERGRVSLEVSEKLFLPILWPTDPSVKEHANVTLNCNTSESSRVDVFWFKDGNPIPAKSLLSEQSRTFHIPDVSRDDEGTYTCQAWNPANSAISNPSRIAVSETEPRSTLAPGAIAAIVLGALAVAALAGTLLYYFFRARRRKNKSSKQMNPTPPVYENTHPSAQVVPVNSSEVNHTYEELQHGSQAVYDQLRW